VLPVLHEDRRQQILVTRVLVGEGRLDRRLHLGDHISTDRRDPVVVELPDVAEEGFEAREWIQRLPLLENGGIANVGKPRELFRYVPDHAATLR